MIPYLQHHYREVVNLFFDPEVVIEKEKWKWDEEKGMLITPLSVELDGLDEIDQDYDFTIATYEEIQEEGISEKIKNKEKYSQNTYAKKYSAEDLALTKLNLIVTGVDTDFVSTLGNPSTPALSQRVRASTMM